MKFRVGIENNNEGIRTIAWLLEHPGCFAYGSNQLEAIDNLPAAIDEYAACCKRVRSCTPPSPPLCVCARVKLAAPIL
jgi:hypothetical protein